MIVPAGCCDAVAEHVWWVEPDAASVLHDTRVVGTGEFQVLELDVGVTDARIHVSPRGT